MACHDPPWCVFLLITVLVGAAATAAADDQSKTLLKFKQSLSNAGALSNWKDSTLPCKDGENNWSGVICAGSNVFGLQLENMGLSGNIDFDTLARLPDLRTISFMNNKFTGKLPAVKKLGAIKALYLSNNAFTGEIPDDEFAGMLSLKKVLLAKNKFTGKIPASLTKLPKLMELRLEGNQFQGPIPDFQQKELKTFDVSNNLLEGPIPPGLSKMDKSSFAGNKDVCGGPMGACNTPNKPEEEPSKNTSNDNNSSDNNSSKKLSPVVIIIVVIVVVLALVGIIVGIILFRRKTQPSELGLDALPVAPSTVQKKSKAATSQELERMEAGAGAGSPEHSSGSGKKGGDNGKLSFVRDDRERFDLPDLLRASAEILGSGCFGSSYKANLLSGAMVVVKRYRQMNNVGKEEFQEHMRRLGRLRHPNLLPLVAYYYRKEEKLLVSDFVERGSLAVHLHGNHAQGQASLDWPTRLKIVKGVAKGLSYLNTELPSLIAPHGHLKSSNVLLDKSFEPLLNDYGLLPVINLEHAQELMVAYKSPEYNQHKRLNKKTDVWSLGILIIEILTGKFPAGYLQKGKGTDDTDLATWVNSVVQTGDGHVFDKEMGSTKNCEGEMTKLLKIGLICCEFDVDKRCDFKEAIERIEELRDKDGDDEFYSVYTDEGDTHSRGLSDDFSSVKNF